MTGSNIRQEALQVLRYFNAATSTVRLFPETAPQVEKSIDKAYQELAIFSEKYGELSFGFTNDQPVLCTQDLFCETPERINEFPVFQHLRMIGLQHVLFKRNLEREPFERILDVFTTAIEKVKKAGGGKIFVKSLRVDEYFPDELEPPEYILDEKEKEHSRQETAVVDVPQQYLLFLFGKLEDRLVIKVEQTLKKFFEVPEKAIAITTAAIARILKGLQKEKSLVVTSLFPQVFSKIDQLMPPGIKREVAVDTALFLVKGLKAPALCVLVSQKYPDGFGQELYDSLVQQVSKETFEKVVELLKKQTEQIDTSSERSKKNKSLLVDSYKRLLDTNKGKQYLASEKVGSIIKGAEQQRQKARIKKSLEALLQGDTKQLQSKEFQSTLPTMIQHFNNEGKEDNIAFLVTQVCNAYHDSDGGTVRGRVVQAVITLTEKLIELENWKYDGKLIPPLVDWLVKANEPDEFYQRCAECLQSFAVSGWHRGEEENANLIALNFHRIRSGAVQKPYEMVDMIARAQDGGFDHDLFQKQIESFLSNPEERGANLHMIHQGPVANRVLLETLFDSEETDDRLKILKVMIKLDDLLSDLVLEYIDVPMAWYKKRNLIKLLGEVGDERHVNVVSEFLNHSDERVRDEALECIIKLGGANKRKHLLSMLYSTDSSMSVRIVEALIPLANEQVAAELIGLLEDRRNFSKSTANKLLINICKALGNSHSVKAVEPLKNFLKDKGKLSMSHVKDTSYRAAAKAIKQIETFQQELKERTQKMRQLQKDAMRKAAMLKTTSSLEKKKS